MVGAAVCSICRTHKNQVHFNTKAGALVCSNCYQKHFQPRRECSVCAKTRTITEQVNGKDYCGTCYKRERLLAVCRHCRKMRRIAGRPDGVGSVCQVCWDARYREHEACVICGQLAPAIVRHADDSPVCYNCWSSELRPKIECVLCGELRVRGSAVEKGPICVRCWFKQHHVAKCPWCGKKRPLMHIEDDWICGTCYPKFMAPKRACSSCGVVEPTTCWTNEGEPLCRVCYRKLEQPRYPCVDCGRRLPICEWLPDGTGRCNTCYERERRSTRRVALVESGGGDT